MDLIPIFKGLARPDGTLVLPEQERDKRRAWLRALSTGGRANVELLVRPSISQRAVDAGRTSGALFDGNGDSAYQHRVRRVQITLESIEGTLIALWSGRDDKSKELKRVAVETVFGTRSWTQVESSSLETLDAGLEALKLFEERIRDGRPEALTSVDSAVPLLADCMRAVESQKEHEQQTVGIL